MTLENPYDVPEPVFSEWYVSTPQATGVVVLDQGRTICDAPPIWRKYIGMSFDVLLGKLSRPLVCPLAKSANSLAQKH